jgi:Tfp pilus assembly protein FimV
MHRRPTRYLSSLLFASAVGAACGTLHAAELGDVRVASHTGQPLAADIDLTMVEEAGQPVLVRVADPEVYRGAGIAMPPVLATLHLAMMRRDGRQVIHVTSLRPVDADHLHLYLELGDHGQRNVRLATLWLTPDPNPAPLPAPAPLPTAKGPVVPATFDDEPAAPPAPAAQHSAQADAAPMPPVTAAAPASPQSAAAHATPPAARPTAALAPNAAPPSAAPPRPATGAGQGRVAITPPSAIPAALARQHAGPAPACAQPTGEAQACVVLGEKNAQLRAQLGRLEQTVSGLQASLGVTPAAQPPHALTTATPHDTPHDTPHETAAAPAPEPAREAARPKSIHSIKPLVPRKAPAPASEGALPWGLIGGAAGVLAAVAAAAAGVTVMRRRRRSTAPAAKAGVEPVLE